MIKNKFVSAGAFKLSKVRLLATVLLLLISFVCHADAPQTSLESLIGQQPDKSSGRFKQDRFLAVLANPLVSTGQFSFEQEQAMSWHIDTPFEIKYNYDGDVLTREEFGETIRLSIKDDPMLVGFFSFFFQLIQGDIKSINRLFDHSITEVSTDTQKIILKPKKRFLEKSFRDIIIDVSKGQLHQLQINESDKDRIVLTFHFSNN